MSKQKQKLKQTSPSTSFINFKNTSRKNILLFLAAILIITYIVYIPSLNNRFTNWDDNVYIAENDLIKSLKADNIKKIFDTENHISLNYHPITILSLAIDYSIDQYNPRVFHRTNLLFHLLNTALVFWLLFLLSNKKLLVASIAALLFAIHPMHVESVAWISERKDVLYVFFFLGALILYLKYLEKQRVILLIGVFVLFLLSILSKAMAIVLPLILFLIDYYKDRKIDKSVILEKLPFLALTLYFGMLAVNIQSKGALADFEVFSLFQRIAFASYGILMYVYKLVVPTGLSCFYPYPHTVEGGGMPTLFYVAPFVVLTLLIGLIYMIRRNKNLVFGVVFFLITVAMVLQFISVGKAIIADRYTYLSYVGLFFVLASGFYWLQHTEEEKWKKFKLPSTVVLVLLLMFFSFLTMQRIKVWSTSETLWTDAIKKHPDNDTPYGNRGSYRINKVAYDLDEKTSPEPDFEGALKDFNMAIKWNSNNPKIFTNRANIFGLKKQFELSLKDYSKAIALDSTDAEVFANRGVTYSYMQQFDNAITDYGKALSLNPNIQLARENRAYAYVNSGQSQKGLEELKILIKENPIKLDYYIYIGVAYFNTHDYNAAIAANSTAIELAPNNAQAYFNRSMSYNQIGQSKKALEDALKAKSLGYAVSESYILELNKAAGAN